MTSALSSTISILRFAFIWTSRRNQEAKRRTFSLFALDSDPATVCFYYTFAYSQTQPRAPFLRTSVGVGQGPFLKYGIQGAGFNARARICDADLHLIILAVKRDRYPSLLGEPERVVDKVLQHLVYPVPVALGDHVAVRRDYLEAHLLFLGLRLISLNDLACDLRQVLLLQEEVKLARLYLGEVQQVRGELRQPIYVPLRYC